MIANFVYLIFKTSSNAELKQVVDSIDVLYQVDNNILKDSDWPEISRAVSIMKSVHDRK
tara:strand:- start:2904 stop:3080 length:177 start_codon:yes stop_codon:yes gene_type:complete